MASATNTIVGGPSISMMARLHDLFARRMMSAVLGRPKAQFLNRVLLSMALRGMGVDNHGETQADERLFVRKRLAKLTQTPIVFDVGANVGQYASILFEEVPHSRVYSFEPNPFAFSQLVAGIHQPDFHAFNLAVGSAPGPATMFDHVEGEGTFHGSLVKGVIENVHHDRAREIPITVTTIDNMMNELKLDRIDLLKIDVEGFEAEVLRGAEHAIREKKIGLVQFEFNEMNTISRVFVQDFIGLLPGYKLHRLLGSGDLLDISDESILRREFFGYQNIVAVAA